MVEEKPGFDWRAPPDWMWRSLVFLVALGALVLITTRWNRWESNAHVQTTDDAYLQSDLLAAQQAQADATLAAQKASLAVAKINLGYTSILAPQAGVIGVRQVKPGQWRSTRSAAQR